jgi:hypothetical protein
MFALHLWAEKEIKFVIRGNENQNAIKEFITGGQPTAIVHLPPSDAAIKGLRTCLNIC